MTPEEKYNREVGFDGARLEVVPLFDRVVPGFVNRIPVLFQFVTGRDPALRREPFSLAVVLDVSGSMQGSRLSNCKAAIAQLIGAAGDDDRLSLVTYSSAVATVFEDVRCGDAGARKGMADKVAALETESATNLYGGLLAGYELLRRQGEARNKHLFLLSDGHVNEGQFRSTEDILRAVVAWEERVPILSYGIGDGFNEQLMSPLGQVHRGSHYFYITDAASIERLVAKGVRALTGAVARNVTLNVAPLTGGLFFPDSMLDGAHFLLVRERSVIQYLVEVEVRPDWSAATSPGDGGFVVVPPALDADVGGGQAASQRLSFAWEVDGFPLLAESRGTVEFAVTADQSFRRRGSPEVQTFLDIRRGCEMRRGAAGSAEARTDCERALALFVGREEHDRFGFAAEWAAKTRALLDDASLWDAQGQAGAAAAKHLGVAYAGAGGRARVEEEEDEEEMDFDLFG